MQRYFFSLNIQSTSKSQNALEKQGFLLLEIHFFVAFAKKQSLENVLDQVRINFSTQQLQILNLCLAFLLFGVALDIRKEDFSALFKSPKAIFVGLLIQLFFFPILTLLMIYVAHPATSVAMAMVLVTACPSGNISNFTVHLAGGNTALSVTITSILSLMAVIITPLSYRFYSSFVPNSDLFNANIHLSFWEMAWTVMQLIAIPLLLGMYLNQAFPKLVFKIKRIVRMLSLAIFFSFIIGGLYQNIDIVIQYLGQVFALVVIQNLLALVSGYYIAKLFRLKERDARTLSFEAGIHNTGLGLILVFNFFNGIGGMAIVAAFWGIWDMISAFLLARWWAKHPISQTEAPQ